MPYDRATVARASGRAIPGHDTTATTERASRTPPPWGSEVAVVTGIRVPRNAVYVFQMRLAVCPCTTAPAVFATGRVLERIIAVADGYWSVYDGFFGDQLAWFHMEIVDVRDGLVVWRDGRPTEGKSYAAEQEERH